MNAYYELANAIVLQAVRDYRLHSNKGEVAQLEEFFRWILRSKEPTIPQVMKFCSAANEPTVTTASPFIEMRYFISAVLA